MSERLHRERTGELLRALLTAAQSPEEEAYAAGFALHLCADRVVHPWVDDQVDGLLASAAAAPEGDADLWHMRLEWGMDCRLLGRQELSHLWTPALSFPQRASGGNLLAQAAIRYYGGDADPDAVRRGEEAVERWLRRLPRLLFWCGKVRPGPWRRPPRLSGWLNRLTASLIGDRLAGVAAYRTQAALAKPWHCLAATPALADAQAEQCLDLFYRQWEERFASFPGGGTASERPSSSYRRS